MTVLDNDIKEIIGLSRETMTYVGFDIIRAADQFPVLRIRVDNVSEDPNSDWETFQVAFQIFFPYPIAFGTFTENVEGSKVIAERYYEVVRELILVGLGDYKGYKINGQIQRRVFNGQSLTEHKTVALQVTVNMSKQIEKDCCPEGTYFDFTTLPDPSSQTWG